MKSTVVKAKRAEESAIVVEVDGFNAKLILRIDGRDYVLVIEHNVQLIMIDPVGERYQITWRTQEVDGMKFRGGVVGGFNIRVDVVGAGEVL